MKNNVKENLLSIDLMLFFILTSIFMIIFVSPWIHQKDVVKYHLDIVSGLDRTTIATNYQLLVDYLWIFHRAPLSLNDFVMSQSGIIHFAEVKTLVDVLQLLWFITGIIGISGAWIKLKKKEIQFLKKTAILLIVVPLSIGLLAMINFDQAFVIFHHIFFRNDYWIFDTVSDPVILILPEQFFMHCFLAIVLGVIIFAGLLFAWYSYRMNKEKALL